MTAYAIRIAQRRSDDKGGQGAREAYHHGEATEQSNVHGAKIPTLRPNVCDV